MPRTGHSYLPKEVVVSGNLHPRRRSWYKACEQVVHVQTAVCEHGYGD